MPDTRILGYGEGTCTLANGKRRLIAWEVTAEGDVTVYDAMSRKCIGVGSILLTMGDDLAAVCDAAGAARVQVTA